MHYDIADARYRADKLDTAIEKYVDGLDLDALIAYVTYDLTQAYDNADSETVDEFIMQMEEN